MATKYVTFLNYEKSYQRSKRSHSNVLETIEQIKNDKKVVELTLWKNNDYLCKSYILNGHVDDLYGSL